MTKKIKYKAPYIVHTRFERNRQNIWVEDAKNRKVAEWWDEEVSSIIGESVINYLVEMGIIKAEQMSDGFKKVWVLPDFSKE